MKSGENIEKLVEETLESLNGIQRAEPTPFFFTRLQARMAREEKNIWERVASLLSKPAVAFASLLLILSFNAFFLFNTGSTTSPGTNSSFSQSSSITEDYFILATNNYDYENLEP